MLLTSSGDNHSSLSINSVQKQTNTAEGQHHVASDRVSSDDTGELLSNNTHMNSDAADASDTSEVLLADVSTNTRETEGTVSCMPLPQSESSRFHKGRVHETELDGLYALRQAAGLNALRRARMNLLGKETLAKLNASTVNEYAQCSSFAAPLAPLRARDIQALSELFLRDDISAIEADVSQRLLALLPEPCWEDEVFAFLGEFL